MSNIRLKVATLLVGALAVLGACSTQVNTLPLPDYSAEIVKLTPLSGTKYIINTTDPVATLRNVKVTVLPSSKNVLILKDSTLQFQIQLSNQTGEVSSNAVYFVIPEQVVTINNQNVTVKGIPDKDKPTMSGLFIWKDQGTIVNEMYFNVSVGTRQWSYSLKK